MEKRHIKLRFALLGISCAIAAAQSQAVSPPGKGTVGSADAYWQDADDGPALVAKVGNQGLAQPGKPPGTPRYNYCVRPAVLNDTAGPIPTNALTITVKRQGNATAVGSVKNLTPIQRDQKNANGGDGPPVKFNNVWCEMGVVGNGPPKLSIEVSGSNEYVFAAPSQHVVTIKPKAPKTANLRALLGAGGSVTNTSEKSPPPKD